MPVKKGDIRPEWVKDKIKATQLLKKEITDIVFKWNEERDKLKKELVNEILNNGDDARDGYWQDELQLDERLTNKLKKLLDK